jgi:hypothetical protein
VNGRSTQSNLYGSLFSLQLACQKHLWKKEGELKRWVAGMHFDRKSMELERDSISGQRAEGIIKTMSEARRRRLRQPIEVPSVALRFVPVTVLVEGYSLDTKSFVDLSLTRKDGIHGGMLTWRAS